MFPGRNESDIAKNIRVIEWLKADLITLLSALYKGMLRGSEQKLLDALSGIIVTCYVLGRRLGFTFSSIDVAVEAKLRKGIEESHEVEKWYGDLTMFLAYLMDRKR
ncbi:MAG: MazG-like family protein [Peptococcaceae bacterium]|nr:MazG-like family protein [Peptococcaceae bacterium]